MAAVTYRTVLLKPVNAFKGEEYLLIERGILRLRKLAEAQYGQVEVIKVDPDGYQAGQLALHTAPSLFEEPKLVIIGHLEKASKALFDDIKAYLKQPIGGVHLVLWATKGVSASALFRSLDKDALVTCEAIKYPKDRVRFLIDEVVYGGGKIEPAAANILVEGLPVDLAELASIVAQLVSDGSGVVTAAAAREYVGGRLATTGYKVADALVKRDVAQALLLVRHLLSTGSAPPMILGALNAKFLQMARLSSTNPEVEKGVPSWQLRQLKQDLRQWNDRQLAAAIEILARADMEVKGGTRSPHYAVEKACTAICRLRG